MSWTLFNHTMPGIFGDAPPLPGTGTPIDATLKYRHSSQQSNDYGILYRGIFAADPEGEQIMLSVDNENVYYSDDGGDSWTLKTQPFSYTTAKTIANLHYHRTTGNWWAFQRNSGSPQSNDVNWSDDNGATWTTTGDDDHNYNLWLLLAQETEGAYDGQIFMTKNVLVESIRWLRWPQPLVNDTLVSIDRSIGFTTIPRETRMSGILNGVNQVWMVKYNTTYGIQVSSDLALDGSTTITNYFGDVSSIGTRNCAFSPTQALIYISEIAGLVTLSKFYVGVSSPLPEIEFDFGFDLLWPIVHYGNGYFVLTARDLTDSSVMYMALMDEETEEWDGPYTINLPYDFDNNTNSLYRWTTQLEYWDNGYWYYGYGSESGTNGKVTLVCFKLGEDREVVSTPADLRLYNAIRSQTPDIFCRMDDAVNANTVVDIGTRGYVNYTIGPPAFDVNGLIADRGTACLIESDVDTGIVVQSVVDGAVDDAHVFFLSHDGTAAIRTLVSVSGAGTPETFTYLIALSSAHELVILDSTFTGVTSTVTLAADTTYLCAVKVESGEATIYVADAWDATGEIVTVERTTAYLTVGGLWNAGDTITIGAEGVTIDYYAMIPVSTFDYQLLVEATGGTYAPPTAEEVVPVSDPTGVQFLCHFDEATLPLVSVNGRGVYEYINSVPGSPNRILTERTLPLPATTPKFGAAAASIFEPFGVYGYEDPWTFPWWEEGDQLELGTQDFTYDMWVNPNNNGFAMGGSNRTYHKQGGKYYEYGGVAIQFGVGKPNEPFGSIGSIKVSIGCTLSQALAGSHDSIHLYFQTFATGTIRHAALCRKNGKFYAFCNGYPGRLYYTPVRRNGEHEDTIYIARGGKWMIGASVGYPGQTVAPRTTGVVRRLGQQVDEVRFIVGRAEYTEAFTPPAAPYNYG